MKPKDDLRIIIDSNIFIYAENPGISSSKYDSEAAAFLRLASQLGFRIVISAATRADLLEAPFQVREIRLRQLAKYFTLPPLYRDPLLAKKAGFPEVRSPNDDADLEVLCALAAGAADWLLTEDVTLRRRSSRAGYSDITFSLSEGIDTLNSFLSKPSSVPSVKTVKGYQISLTADIFGSLREDYPPQAFSEGFDFWWHEKVAKGHRDVLVLGPLLNPEGLAVLKIENDQPHGLQNQTLKICTFKVSEGRMGSRLGELLLKATVDYARRNNCVQAYLEVLPEKGALINWLASFGFTLLEGSTTIRSEQIYVKAFQPSPACRQPSPLGYNVLYGPGAILIEQAHIVPIQARWHRRLLPEAEAQISFLASGDACGNAIRKAYLCHAPTRQVGEGNALLFLRTTIRGTAAVTAIGVTEATLVSRRSSEIIAFVGNRTVYTADEIEGLCLNGAVLAIRFRLDRVLSPSWSRRVLQTAGVLQGNAQTIQRVQGEGATWIRQQLDE